MQRERTPVEEIRWAAIEGALAAEEGNVAVDPRPIALYVNGTFPESRHYRVTDTATLDAITASLNSRSVDTATAFPMPACGFIMMPEDMREMSGCPADQISILAFDTPVVHEPGKWIVRMVGVGYSPKWAMVVIYEITVEERDGHYTVVGIKPVVHFE